MASPPPISPSRARARWAWVWVPMAAIGAALLLRGCVAEAFRIPSPSMEGTLLVGDYVLTSKLHYGARTPETLRLPFTEHRVGGLRLPSARTPGLGRVRRGDVVVFHHPGETGPLDGRTPYVKRVVGLPGDTVALVGKRLYVNGQAADLPSSRRQDWTVTVHPGSDVRPPALDTLPVIERAGLRAWRVRTGPREAAALAALPTVESVEPAPGRPDGALFPPGTAFTPDDFGPVVLPRAGVPLPLTDDDWPALRATLEREGRAARRIGPGRYEVDGWEADSVTFRQDYYFVLGDSQDDSADSRRWGLVPADHLIGRAVLVYFSWDPERGRVRTERLLRAVR
jgi:signal peptidase I